MPAASCCGTRGAACCFGGSTGPTNPLLPWRPLLPGPRSASGLLPSAPLLGQGPLSVVVGLGA
eukprot:12992482-Alexandrium_andersonii.AAC.1